MAFKHPGKKVLEKYEENSHDEEINKEKYMQEFEKSKKFVKKIAEEKKIRVQKAKEREKEMMGKVSEEIERLRIEKKVYEAKRIEEKERKKEEIEKRAEERKRLLEEAKSEGNNSAFLIEKPLYVQMEENFKQNFIMPEMEKSNSILAKKRLLYQPISHKDIVNHIKKHKSTLISQEKRRKNAFLHKRIEIELNTAASIHHNKFIHAIAKEQLKSQQVLSNKIQEKKNNIFKRQQYSKLIQEIFQPTFDEKKKKNEEFNRAKSKKSTFLTGSASNLNFKQKFNEKEFKSVSEAKTRKWKKNKMVPEVQKRKLFVKRDYLAELRNGKRKENEFDWEKELNSGEFDIEKIEKIKAKAGDMEKEAMRLGVIRNNSNENIEKVNFMLLSSIKAKLALLEKMNASSYYQSP